MTKITYDPAVPAITMEGHAGAGPWGQDLVCAALSTLAALLEAAGGESERGPGRFAWRGGETAVARAAAAVGLQLSEDWPDFVRWEVKT